MYQLLGEEIHVSHVKLLGRKSQTIKPNIQEKQVIQSPKQAMCQLSPPEGMPITITALQTTTKLKNFNIY